MLNLLRTIARARPNQTVGALGLAVATIHAGCTFSADNLGVNPPAELRLGIAQGSSGGDTSSGAPAIASLIAFEGLTSLSGDGHAFPRIVEKWITSRDGLEWRFVLRSNVTFHDGSPVTQEDIRSSIASKIGDYPGLKDIIDVSVDGTNQVVVRLREPSSMLVEDLNSQVIKTVGSRQVGTGPFEIVSQTPSEVSLEAYARYYAKTPQLHRLTLRAFPNFTSAYSSLLRGQLDGIYAVGHDDLEFLTGDSTIGIYPYTRPYHMSMVFNSLVPTLRDPRIRQALNFGVNRQAIISAALRGHGREAGTAVWPAHWAFDELNRGFGYDPARAGALLNAAGVTGRPRLRIRCLLMEGYETWERVALVVQQQLAELDVDVQFELLPYDAMMERLPRGDFEAVLTELNGGPGINSVYRFWHAPNSRLSRNFWNYRSERTDAALDAVLHSVHDDDYRRAVSLVQRAIVDDPPAVFLVWVEASRAVSRRFDLFVQPNQDIRETLASWRLARGERRRAN